MKLSQKGYLLPAACLTLSLMLSACGNQSDQSDNSNDKKQTEQKQSQNNTKQNEEPKKDLKSYSKDPDKNDPSEGDFDLVGTLVKETDKTVTLDIKGKTVDINKKSSFEKEMKGFKDALEGKQVVVEVSTDNQEAESLKPTDRTRADKNGVYEKDDGKDRIIGKLVTNEKDQVTIETEDGKKTYKKTNDFELDDEAQKQNDDLKGKYVHLHLDDQNKVEELEYSWVDQE